MGVVTRRSGTWFLPSGANRIERNETARCTTTAISASTGRCISQEKIRIVGSKIIRRIQCRPLEAKVVLAAPSVLLVVGLRKSKQREPQAALCSVLPFLLVRRSLQSPTIGLVILPLGWSLLRSPRPFLRFRRLLIRLRGRAS